MLGKFKLGKKALLGVAGAGLLLLGGLGGALYGSGLTAFASSATTRTVAAKGDYCSLYEQTLANQLGVSTSALENANTAALTAVINQAEKDGKISASQQAKLEQRLQSGNGNICATVHRLTARAPRMAALKQARKAVAQALAQKMGITTKALAADLKAGQTLPQIAQAHGVSQADLNATYESAVQAQLAQAVKNGTITQAQSNALYARIQKAVARGIYPFFGAGHAKSGATAAPTAVPQS